VHLILIAIILGLVIVIVLQTKSSHNSESQPGSDRTLSGGYETQADPIAFVSNGKLFHRSPGEDTQEISSPYIQKLLQKEEQKNSLHGWKKGTSFDSNLVGSSTDTHSDAVSMSFQTAEFVDTNTLLYFLSDGSVGGLFEQNLETGEERRLLHQQKLDLDHFHYDAANDRILCSSGSENGIRNLAAIDRANNNIVQYTEGDTIDAMPCSYPGQPKKVVMQSSGIGRSEGGYMMAVGPASLNVLTTDPTQLEPIVGNDQFDFLRPVVHPNGNLYYVRRPFEQPRVGTGAFLLDVVLFPFRIARAVFHYLNFFSLMYTQKPLTSASGPKVQRDRKQIEIQGKRIDAEKAQRQAGVVRGVPSLVPSTWQLVSRNPHGQETTVAHHVVSFDISSSGNIFYTNGFGVFKVTEEGPELLFKESLVEKILVY